VGGSRNEGGVRVWVSGVGKEEEGEEGGVG